MKNKRVWNDTSNRIALNSNIEGHFAMWAVRQSPYLMPESLTQGIKEFSEALKISKDDFKEITCDDLKKIVADIISKSNIISSWNVAKKGTGPVFVSRYDEPESDYDFIDLDALARNVAHSVWLEICYDDGFFEPKQDKYKMKLEEIEEKWKSEGISEEKRQKEMKRKKAEEKEQFLDEWCQLWYKNQNGFYRKPVGWFRKFCPVCKAKLKKYSCPSGLIYEGDFSIPLLIRTTLFRNGGIRLVNPFIYECENCGYEFAERTEILYGDI